MIFTRGRIEPGRRGPIQWENRGAMTDAEGREVEVKRTYLELRSRDAFHPVFLADERARVAEVKHCPASFYRYLYAEVGRFYHWTDRLGWTDAEIRAHLAQEGLSLWVLYYEEAPAGYFELCKGEDGSTELAYFGLLPEYLGRGLGKHLLSAAITQAWEDGAGRVWLHTRFQAVPGRDLHDDHLA